MATLVSLERDQERVKEVVSGLSLPKGVGKPKVEYREDHSGDDAVYITFPVSRKVSMTKKRSEEIFEFSEQVRRALYSAGIDRLAYILVSEVK